MWRRKTQFRCQHCNNPCKRRCEGCKTTYYCSRKHQMINWEQHKKKCRSNQNLQISREFTRKGARRRVLTAHANFKKGEQLFSEKIILKSPDTLLQIPRQNGFQVGDKSSCIVCHKILKIESTSGENKDAHLHCFPHCSWCKWSTCSDKCLNYHRLLECKVLKFLPFPSPNIFSIDVPHWKFILYLRVLTYEQNNPRSFRTLLGLDIAPEIDDYYEILSAKKKRDSVTIPQLAIRYDNTLFDLLKILKHFKQYHWLNEIEKLRRVIEIVDWNSVPIWLNSDKEWARVFYGLYHINTAVKQCCIPNAIFILNSKGKYEGVCIASKDITKGDIIKFCKVQTSQDLLKDNYSRDVQIGFRNDECFCQRCTDPTELGSYIGALKCIDFKNVTSEGCKLGNLLPYFKRIKPKTSDRTIKIWRWKCDSCGIERSRPNVQSVVQKLNLLYTRAINKTNMLHFSTIYLHDFDMNMLTKCPIAVLVRKLENVMLHPNHSMLFTMKMTLLKHYSDVVERILKMGQHFEFSSQIVNAAMFMFITSEELLRILDKINPGLSIERANLAFYKQEAFILLAPKVVLNLKNSREKTNFRGKLDEIMTERKETYLVFRQYSSNSHHSYEHKINWMKVSGKLYQMLRQQYSHLFAKPLPTNQPPPLIDDTEYDDDTNIWGSWKDY